MKRLASSLVIAASLGITQLASAATQNANFNVTANVGVTCTLTIPDLAFGNYDPTSLTPLSGQTTISLTCTSGAAATIDLDQGGNAAGGSSATVPLRRMTDGANFISYGLFQDAGFTTPWGTGGGTSVATIGTGAVQSISIFGQIPATQSPVGVGAYTDPVVATVNF